jgi:drug/metabolite transporter (DMT)-like permease
LTVAGDAVRGAAAGLAAAALFGVSAPLAKKLLPATGPLVLAALLYLGAGIALTLAGWVTPRGREAPLRRADLPALAAIALLGGVAGPLLMLAGLGRVSATAGSLLLNLEAVFTIVLAVMLFGEHVTRRGALASALVVAGAAVLSGGAGGADALGIALVAGACLAWGVDNNLTQRLSLRDPVALGRAKTLSAGTLMLAAALATGRGLPDAGQTAAALAVGAAGYGVSIVLDVVALRLLGAAREAAFFATAPFLGALAAVPIFDRMPGPAEAASAAIMVLGVVLLVRDRHGHVHAHGELDHDHVHVHDEHHRHGHDGPVVEPHAHPHHHAPLTHDHPHVSDLHHRHPHE